MPETGLQGTGLGFSFDGRRACLENVELAIQPGRVTGVTGPNGAGKSTLLRILAGLMRPDDGTVTLDGIPLDRLPRLEVARRIAVCFQNPPDVLGFCAQDVALMGRYPHRTGPAEDARAVREAMEQTGSAPIAGRRLNTLSGGERQLVHLARALAQDPRYLLLDEPTANLDPGHQVRILRLTRRLAREGRGILLVTHDLHHIRQVCDEVALLQGGRRVAQGPPSEVLTEGLLERVYGVRPVRQEHTLAFPIGEGPA